MADDIVESGGAKPVAPPVKIEEKPAAPPVNQEGEKTDPVTEYNRLGQTMVAKKIFKEEDEINKK